MNTIAYFEIQADDPAAAMGFYETIFGRQFQKQSGLPVDYWRIITEGIQGGLLARPAPAPPSGSGTNAFVCSIQVEDFDATAAKIIEQGGVVDLEKFAVPDRCWQGYHLDNQGNTFGIFEGDENAK